MSSQSMGVGPEQVRKNSTSLVAPLLLGAGKVGDGARSVVIGGAKKYGTAGTGRAISELHGVAAYRAALARLGGGPLDAGGRGMAGGNAVLTAVQFAPVVLTATAIGVGVLLKQRADATAARDEARESGTCAHGHEMPDADGEVSADPQAGARCAGREGESSRPSGFDPAG